MQRFSRKSKSPKKSGRSGDRMLVGARISAPVQTGPEAQPAFYTMGTGSFQGVKRPGRGFDHPSHLAPRLRNCYRKNFTFTFTKLHPNRSRNTNSIYIYTRLFISPSGISELDCATTKTDTAERSISIGRESLQVFFLY